MADEEPQSSNDAQYLAELNARREEVGQYLSKRDKTKALIASLNNPPVLAKSSEIKDENTAIIERVLSTMNESEINAAIESMNTETMETFLKYVYKLMGKSFLPSMMLKVHASITDKTGKGAIMRVLTDKKV